MTKRGLDPVLLAITVVSLLTNVFLLYHILRKPAPEPISHSHTGTKLERVEITDGGSRNLELRNGNKSTIIYVFSPNCGWCSRNYASVTRLAEAVQRDYVFVGLAVSDVGLKEYSAKYPLNFPVHVASRDSVKRLKLSTTPETILVGPDGTVERDWFGAYAGLVGSDVGAYFKTDLPRVSFSPGDD